jgi:hypothetical protein
LSIAVDDIFISLHRHRNPQVVVFALVATPVVLHAETHRFIEGSAV